MNSKMIMPAIVLFSATLPVITVYAQPGRQADPVPDPMAVSLPEIQEISGNDPVFDSSQAQWPGFDMAHYDYQIREFLISGTAAGKPYSTRMAFRMPADISSFSGLVVAEPMHPAGQAHGFQHNSVYLMDAGHIEVEITTSGFEQIRDFNPDRYGSLQLENDQVNEILAQAGALLKSSANPIPGMQVRKVVLWGTSASSQIVARYMPFHEVYRRGDMQHIYDGYMPTSNGSNISAVSVPTVQLPTQHEFSNIATSHQDSDEPGSQFRVYEFVAVGHLMARNNQRLTQDMCVHPITTMPIEPYFSVALHHLLEWVDKGIVPPRADRVLVDRNVDNDGSLMSLDINGNPVGGIRNPYVDVPVTKYTAYNQDTPGRGPSNLCRLSMWETDYSPERLRDMYVTKENYLRRFEASLDAAEAEGWSLPVYHELIMADARAVEF